MIVAVLAWILAGTEGVLAQSHPGIRHKSNIHDVNVGLRRQMSQLRKDVKSGKVGQDQAKVVLEQFKAVRKQELEYFHLNGQREVTAAQKAQLEQLLSQTASAI